MILLSNIYNRYILTNFYTPLNYFPLLNLILIKNNIKNSTPTLLWILLLFLFVPFNIAEYNLSQLLSSLYLKNFSILILYFLSRRQLFWNFNIILVTVQFKSKQIGPNPS